MQFYFILLLLLLLSVLKLGSPEVNYMHETVKSYLNTYNTTPVEKDIRESTMNDNTSIIHTNGSSTGEVRSSSDRLVMHQYDHHYKEKVDFYIRRFHSNKNEICVYGIINN